MSILVNWNSTGYLIPTVGENDWGLVLSNFLLDLGNNAAVKTATGALSFAATGSPTLRSQSDRAHDYLNVKDFGAALDGVTNDAAALQATRAVAHNDQTIIMGAGQLLKTFNPSSGPSTVLWKLDGTKFPGGVATVFGIGANDTVETVLGGGKFIARNNTSALATGPVLRLDMTNNYAGGGGGNVFSNLKVNTTSTNAAIGFSWGVNSALTSNSIAGTNSQDVSVAASIFRGGAAATWQFFGQTVDSTGLSPNSSSAIVGTEQNIICNGVENVNTNWSPGTGGRVGIHFSVGAYQPPVWTPLAVRVATMPASVVTPTVVNPFTYVCTTSGTSSASEPAWPLAIGATVTDGTAVWTCSATINTQVSRLLNFSGDATATVGTGIFTDVNHYNAILDFSFATLTPYLGSKPAAIRLAANMPIDFSANQTLAGQNQHTLLFDSVTSKLFYQVAGVNKFSIDNSGNIRCAGTVTGSVTP